MEKSRFGATDLAKVNSDQESNTDPVKTESEILADFRRMEQILTHNSPGILPNLTLENDVQKPPTLDDFLIFTHVARYIHWSQDAVWQDPSRLVAEADKPGALSPWQAKPLRRALVTLASQQETTDAQWKYDGSIQTVGWRLTDETTGLPLDEQQRRVHEKLKTFTAVSSVTQKDIDNLEKAAQFAKDHPGKSNPYAQEGAEFFRKRVDSNQEEYEKCWSDFVTCLKDRLASGESIPEIASPYLHDLLAGKKVETSYAASTIGNCVVRVLEKEGKEDPVRSSWSVAYNAFKRLSEEKQAALSALNILNPADMPTNVDQALNRFKLLHVARNAAIYAVAPNIYSSDDYPSHFDERVEEMMRSMIALSTYVDHCYQAVQNKGERSQIFLGMFERADLWDKNEADNSLLDRQSGVGFLPGEQLYTIDHNRLKMEIDKIHAKLQNESAQAQAWISQPTERSPDKIPYFTDQKKRVLRRLEETLRKVTPVLLHGVPRRELSERELETLTILQNNTEGDNTGTVEIIDVERLLEAFRDQSDISTGTLEKVKGRLEDLQDIVQGHRPSSKQKLLVRKTRAKQLDQQLYNALNAFTNHGKVAYRLMDGESRCQTLCPSPENDDYISA